jgi:phage regulator Rha-like protein
MPVETSLIVIEQETPLADSRAIAQQLGVEHRSFFRLITEYQEEIAADFGKVRFEIAAVKTPGSRGTKQTKYALLTEDQTYAYMSYSQNALQARACKRLLVKAFREAREHLQAAPTPPQINSLWQRHLEIFNQGTRIPEGYWCIFGMVAAYCRTDEYRGIHLSPDALPDVSVGQMWCQHLRESGFDMRLVKKYPHVYPDLRGVQLANLYLNAWLGEYWTWFHGTYLKKHYPAYLQAQRVTTSAEAETPRLLPQTRTRRKQWQGQKRDQRHLNR